MQFCDRDGKTHVTSSTFLDKAACLQLSCVVRQVFVCLCVTLECETELTVYGTHWNRVIEKLINSSLSGQRRQHILQGSNSACAVSMRSIHTCPLLIVRDSLLKLSVHLRAGVA